MHATRDHLRITLLFFILIIAITSDAPVVLRVILSDNRALQYVKPLTVWGKASAGEAVTVSFQNKKSSYPALPTSGVLATSDGKLLDCFTIAGDNGIFVPVVPFGTDHLKTD